MQRLEVVGVIAGARFAAGTAHLELLAGGTPAAPTLTAINYVTRETVVLTPQVGAQAAVTAFATHGGTRTAITVDSLTGSVLPEAIAQARALNGAASVTAFLGVTAIQTQAVELVTAVVGTSTYLYAARPSGAGVAVYELAPDGAISLRAMQADGANTYLAGVTAMLTLAVGEARYLYAGSGAESGISIWRIEAGGALTAVGGLGPAEGLPVAGVSVLRSVELGGVRFVVAGAAGSDSLTVLRVGDDGRMTVTDHLIDDLSTRFDGITALDTITVAGRAFVVAAGADAGISLFLLSPDGRLIHLSTLADTAEMGLRHVSSVEMVLVGGELQVIVGSAAEAGLTVLRINLTGLGEIMQATQPVVTGTAQADLMMRVAGQGTLEGGAGDDVLIDGAGEDVLRGGAGADIFLLTADGKRDVILDFEPGVDRIDLSLWPMLRSVDAIAITPTAQGAILTFGAEVLEIRTMAGTSLSVAQVKALALLPVTRVAVTAGPPLPTGVAVHGTPVGDTLAAGVGDDSLYGGAGDDLLLAGLGAVLFDGGEGVDTVSYAGMAAVVVDLATPSLNAGAAAGHRHLGIEAVIGSGFADRIAGDGGDNALWGENGMDHLSGGAGHDSLYGGAGNDTLIGGSGNDSLYGAQNNDSLLGEDGNDLLDGGSGNDTLFGGAGEDTLRGADHADLLYGGEGNDLLEGGGGQDTLYGGEGADLLYGGADDDWLVSGPGGDLFDGGQGVDTVDFSAETSGATVDLTLGTGGGAAAGDTFLSIENVVGTRFDDRIIGTASANLLIGGDGRDWLEGWAADDVLDGGAGNDSLFGGVGNDVLYGGLGNDSLNGGPGRNLSYGGAGNDTLQGGSGIDLLYGGEDHDSLIGNLGADSLWGGAGNDKLSGGNDDDWLWGEDGNDMTWGGGGNDWSYGGAGNDAMRGDGGDDWLDGGAGDDQLIGGTGNDTLLGGDGNDRLNGELGNDVLIGGLGNDLFVFSNLKAGERDIITDFQDGIDRLQFNGLPGETRAERFAAISISATSYDGQAATLLSVGGHDVLLIGASPDWFTVADFVFY